MSDSASLTQFLVKRASRAKLLSSLSESQLETFALLSDVDQATDLLVSMLEAQQNAVVPFDLAFADLD
ncbi:MAG: hypothetical protein KC476_06900 [Cyanobacteria bacterium HKST-UBA06]|nr:hypothetical protein [Cyanobacteria bacterium HKST-UBA05]MCA9798936.1 hypothetical protein [Cyanobacteria bacterium HKST-UBA04]MCA9807668.1 hypothetical protein [Cyanobacteria bacterium HKST-UBA06]